MPFESGVARCFPPHYRTPCRATGTFCSAPAELCDDGAFEGHPDSRLPQKPPKHPLHARHVRARGQQSGYAFLDPI